MISLTYQFIFERDANIWSNVTEFDRDLSDFFKANGLDASIIVTVEGSGGNRIIMIRKNNEPEMLTNPKGGQLSNKTQRSSVMVNNLSKSLNSSFNAQNVNRSK
jgi:hypothetical protein